MKTILPFAMTWIGLKAYFKLNKSFHWFEANNYVALPGTAQWIEPVE